MKFSSNDVDIFEQLGETTRFNLNVDDLLKNFSAEVHAIFKLRDFRLLRDRNNEFLADTCKVVEIHK